MHHGFYGAEKRRRASLVLISPLVVPLPPFRILVVMWVEASSPYAPCDWEGGVAIVSIILIVPMSLMSLILAFSSTRLLPLCFAFGVGLVLSVMTF